MKLIDLFRILVISELMFEVHKHSLNTIEPTTRIERIIQYNIDCYQ